MDIDKNLRPLERTAAQSIQVANQTRMKCSSPIMIKGFNAQGEHYEELALIEDVGWRGVCLRTDQTVIPGSIFTIYKTEDDLDPLATFEVVWIHQYDGKIRKAGAQLIGDNGSWLQYLVRDIAVLPETVITRTNM
jgi:hypothetical protein